MNDLQQQKTGFTSTNNPQALVQPQIVSIPPTLQQTGNKDINQLSATTLSVTSSCSGICSGTVSPATTTSKGISSSIWVIVVIVVIAVIVVAVLAGMFRKLSGSPSK